MALQESERSRVGCHPVTHSSTLEYTPVKPFFGEPSNRDLTNDMSSPKLWNVSRTEIKALRKKLKLTQEDMARLLGVRVRQVARWESGDSKPSRLAQQAISRLS